MKKYVFSRFIHSRVAKLSKKYYNELWQAVCLIRENGLVWFSGTPLALKIDNALMATPVLIGVLALQPG